MKTWNELPVEIQERMLDEQVEQGNKRDKVVFEKRIGTNYFGFGFTWDDTVDGPAFWLNVLNGDFDLFFNRYPKTTAKSYPRVMQVSDSPITKRDERNDRVVFMEKNGRYLAWSDVTTEKEAEKVTGTCTWLYARDVDSFNVVSVPKEYTMDEIAARLGVNVRDLKIKK